MTRSGKRKDATVAASSTTKRTKTSDAATASDEEATAVAVETTKPAAARKKRAVANTDIKVPTWPDPADFDHYLFQLLSYKADNNNFHVNKEEYPALHAWLQYLKREYKLHLAAQAEGAEENPTSPTACSLTEDQLKVLQYLHVPLTSRGDDHWNRFYQLLIEYKERHDHVLVPRLCEVPGLGDWVTDQRRQYKGWKQGSSSQLTADRRQKLNALGFVWQVRNRPEWDQRYNEMLEYKEKFGDCKVPQHYKANKALGKWVAKQREQFKLLKKAQHSFLTPYRLEKLNDVGFVWQVRTGAEDVKEAAAPVAASSGGEVPTPLAAAAAKPGPKEEEEEQSSSNPSAAVTADV